MKKQTLFSHLKEYINDNWNLGTPREFTTKHMRQRIGRYENLTAWKKWNNNPNYVLHTYLGQLRELGCITRIKHGMYKINAPIPEWFGSHHFAGLKGRLEHCSNLYWNNLPAEHKVNPWAKFVDEPKQVRIEDALGAWPDLEVDKRVREQYPANVEGFIEFRIAAMQERLNKQIEQLQSIKNMLIELKAEADRQNQVELRYTSEYVQRIFEVSYLGDKYRVIHTYNSDDVYDEQWKVDNYVVDQISNNEITEYLISWVKENCK